jgi:two-component system OmpR family sensor kinase
MSATSSQLGPKFAQPAVLKGRSPLAHLLHALNQPLTGLQCSLELAATGARAVEEYVRTLHEGLELTSRMRILVEAIRELTDIQTSDAEVLMEAVQFDTLLRDTVEELLPVAESRNVRLLLAGSVSLPVQGDSCFLKSQTFRFLESALSLTRKGSDLEMMVSRESERACLLVSWRPGQPPPHSPFSRAELGLLIVQAGLEEAGAEWSYTRTETPPSCTVRLSLASKLCRTKYESGDLL